MINALTERESMREGEKKREKERQREREKRAPQNTCIHGIPTSKAHTLITKQKH